LFFVTTICSAQINLQINKEGDYRENSKFEWFPSEIIADSLAIKYINRFAEAKANPGKNILVYESKKIIKLKPVFKKLVEIEKAFIVYNKQTKNIDYIKTKPIRQRESCYLILFSVISIFLMMAFNILSNKNLIGYAVLIAIIATLINVVIFLITINVIKLILIAAIITITIATVIAAIITKSIPFICDAEDYKNHKILSRLPKIFCVLMIIYIIFMFMGI
jgi:hypothetical protein